MRTAACQRAARRETGDPGPSARAARPAKPLRGAPLLTRSQEVALARRIRAANAKTRRRSRARRAEAADAAAARDQFIQANLGLVWSIARKYRWVEGVDLHELVQEGCTGLIEAVERFDPAHGTRFSTYATWWILKAIRRSIDEKSRLIRLPVHMLNRLRELRKLIARLQDRCGGRQPGVYELAAAMEADPLEVQFLLDLGRLPQSLDEALACAGDDPHAERLTDTRAPSPEEFAERRRLHGNLRRALAGLSPLERKIIERRFGLASREPETLQSIGRSLGVSRDRARQIEKLLLETLRDSQPLRETYREMTGYRGRPVPAAP